VGFEIGVVGAGKEEGGWVEKKRWGGVVQGNGIQRVRTTRFTPGGWGWVM